MVICIAAVAFYFLYFKNDNAISTAKSTIPPGNIKPVQPTQKTVTNKKETGMLSREQIKAILKDTTGIIHFRDQPGELAAGKKDPVKKLTKNNNALL